MTKIKWILPIKTVSEANSSEHWRTKHARHKQQQFVVRAMFAKEQQQVPLPCAITLIRLSPRALDPDNLPVSMKWIQDEVAEQLTGKGGFYRTGSGLIKAIKGHADGDKRLSWAYAQEKWPTQAVRIEIEYQEGPKNAQGDAIRE